MTGGCLCRLPPTALLRGRCGTCDIAMEALVQPTPGEGEGVCGSKRMRTIADTEAQNLLMTAYGGESQRLPAVPEKWLCTVLLLSSLPSDEWLRTQLSPLGKISKFKG